ncbi:hypothetical protein F8B91_11595 [Aestuariivirga litoralis]|nr:hypothetical protein [Aestuariivirga litoralis]
MPLDLDGDLAVFFNTDEFAKPATYQAKTGGAVTIQVLFDKAWMNLADMASVGVSTVNPMARAKTADLLDGGSAGETLVIASTTYQIRDVQPDGQGVTTLELQKV